MHMTMAAKKNVAATARRRDRAAGELARMIDSDLLRAMCEPARVEIIRYLTACGRCDIATIAEHVAPDRSVVSRHLATLHRAGIVRREKQGRNVFFELDGPAIVERMESMLDNFRRIVPLCCPATLDDARRMES
jgi:DNA-binding transcriptional ArsR family regulator